MVFISQVTWEIKTIIDSLFWELLKKNSFAEYLIFRLWKNYKQNFITKDFLNIKIKMWTLNDPSWGY